MLRDCLGIVTTWFDRGAAYVSRAYRDVLGQEFDVQIYARGGEVDAGGDPRWNAPYVYRARRPSDFRMDRGDFENWLCRHRISVVLFNEQQWWPPVLWARDLGVRTISYVDYYTRRSMPWFAAYDALWCNTRRHYEVFSWHPGAVYIPWGTDLGVYTPAPTPPPPPIVFFHSAGMAGHNLRKGTDLLVRAFTNVIGDARLVIHSQVPITSYEPVADLLAADTRIEFIERTAPPPGLYRLGHVYVYPARLDGLGLTVPEALSSGLPVIATNSAPFTDFIEPGLNGWLVTVASTRWREDGYYWPETECDVQRLREAMQYCTDHQESTAEWRAAARRSALDRLDWVRNSGGLGDRVREVISARRMRLSDDVRRAILTGSGTGRLDIPETPPEDTAPARARRRLSPLRRVAGALRRSAQAWFGDGG